MKDNLYFFILIKKCYNVNNGGDNLKDFNDNFEEFFEELLKQITTDLLKNDYNYQNSIEKTVKIVEEYPNVRKVCEDKKAVALNIDETNVLIQYMTCCEYRNTIQNKKLLLLGGKYAYLILKKLDLLK